MRPAALLAGVVVLAIIGGLLVTGVLQVAPTPDSVKVANSVGRFMTDSTLSLSISWPFTPSPSGYSASGVSVMIWDTDTGSNYIQTKVGCGTKFVFWGNATMLFSGTGSKRWYTFASSGPSAPITGSCTAYVTRGSRTNTPFVTERTTGIPGIVVWGQPAPPPPGSPIPPPPPPGTGTDAEGETLPPPPPPPPGSELTLILFVLVLVIIGVAVVAVLAGVFT